MAEIDYIKRAEEFWRRQEEAPNRIDAAVDHYVKVAKTQAAIIEEIKKMAQVMAAAAIASEKSVGDRPETAIFKWSRILIEEANRLVQEQRAASEAKSLPDGKTIDQEPA